MTCSRNPPTWQSALFRRCETLAALSGWPANVLRTLLQPSLSQAALEEVVLGERCPLTRPGPQRRRHTCAHPPGWMVAATDRRPLPRHRSLGLLDRAQPDFCDGSRTGRRRWPRRRDHPVADLGSSIVPGATPRRIRAGWWCITRRHSGRPARSPVLDAGFGACERRPRWASRRALGARSRGQARYRLGRTPWHLGLRCSARGRPERWFNRRDCMELTGLLCS